MNGELKLSILIISLAIIAVITIPKTFPLINETKFTENYRIPYHAGEDYFLFKKHAKFISKTGDIPLIGDSVIWGHYVKEEETLSACLNKKFSIKFRNSAIDGVHPAAMNGLVENFYDDIKNKKIILGINLLWMSSSRHDLSGEKNNEINHKALLPQFFYNIPSYQPEIEERLSFVIKKNFEFLLWIDHIKINKFASNSFYSWTMENRDKNIIDFFIPQQTEFIPPQAMETKTFTQRDVQWIDVDKSLQWQFTLKTIELLKNRKNSILAIITPFNKYMMTPRSVAKMESIINTMENELQREGVNVIALPMLLPEEFADGSHPTSKGYQKIAAHLSQSSDFLKFISK